MQKRSNIIKVSIIVPVYNEEKTIKEVLSRIRGVNLSRKISKEIIIIDDASTDSTTEILKKEKKNSFILLSHKKNLGKGASVKVGIQKASGQIFIIQDADLEYNPQDYSKLLEPILKKEVSVVYGTRLKNYPLKFWGNNKTVLPTHLLANRFLTTLTNILYGGKLTDMETCYKVFTRQAVDGIQLKSNRFEIEPELTAKFLKKGISIYEVPIITKPRTYHEGKKIGILDGLLAIWTLFKYRFTN